MNLKIRLNNQIRTTMMGLLGLSAVAVGNPLTIPAPGYSAPTPTVVKQECKRTPAVVFTVTELSRCNEQLPNSYLRGAINRLKPCVKESVVAHAFASTHICEDCKSACKVDELRAARRPCSCGNGEYLEALVEDLTSRSRKVRIAAQRSLRLCGYRVTHEVACVEEKVPSVIYPE